MDKSTLRNRVKEALATMSEEAYLEQSLAIVKKSATGTIYNRSKNDWYYHFQ